MTKKVRNALYDYLKENQDRLGGMGFFPIISEIWMVAVIWAESAMKEEFERNEHHCPHCKKKVKFTVSLERTDQWKTV